MKFSIALKGFCDDLVLVSGSVENWGKEVLYQQNAHLVVVVVDVVLGVVVVVLSVVVDGTVLVVDSWKNLLQIKKNVIDLHHFPRSNSQMGHKKVQWRKYKESSLSVT